MGHLLMFQRVDTKPSLLERALRSRDISKEPEPKRPKITEDGSISSRAAANAYTSLDEVISDIRSASRSIKDEFNLPTGTSMSRYQPLSPADSQLSTHIGLLVKKAEDLTQRQKAVDALKSKQSTKLENDPSALTNGTSSAAPIAARVGDGKLVLSLYGGLPNSRDTKQMFSSLQKGVKEPSGTINAPKPLREIALPNNISTTQIVSNVSFGEDKNNVATLGEHFAPVSLQFQPPRPHRSSSSKGLAVGWAQPSLSETSRSRNNQSYYSQPVKAGQWLEYRGTTKQNDPRRRQKDRAMSLSGIRPSVTDAQAEAEGAQEVDALFRSAYSSFAPTKDDSAAVVPQGELNRIWWQRVGEDVFQKLASTFEHVEMKEESSELQGAEVNDEEVKDAIEHWDQLIDPELQASISRSRPEKSVEEKDAEEVLESISELLETLNSYQRNRNLAAPAISASAIPPRTGAPPLVITPSVSQPDEMEMATYSTLKAQLALMIATLPPYAVAKLNSDQLSELNISTKVPVLTEPYKGVLDEDDYAKAAKVQAMSVASVRAAATPSHNRNPSSMFGNYNTAPRPAAPAATSSQYYSTPVRTSGPIRPPQTAGMVPYAAPRQISGPGFNQGVPRAPGIQGLQGVQSSYANPTAAVQTPRAVPQQQFAQNASAYYNTPQTQRFAANGMTGTVPQQMRYQPPQQAPQNFQQRPIPQTNGMAYNLPNGMGTPIQRQPSPAKPLQHTPTPMAGMGQGIGQGMGQGFNNAQSTMPQQQRNYGTPSAAQTYYGGNAMGLSAGVPMPPTMQQQISNGSAGSGVGAGLGGGMATSPINTNGVQNQVPATTGVLGPTGYRTTMSPAEEANLIERAKLQSEQQRMHNLARQNVAGQMGLPMSNDQQMNQMTPDNQNTRMGGM